MTKRTLALIATGLCALAATTPATAADGKRLPALTPTGPDALTRALARGELSEADYALERARSLFELGRVRREFGDVERANPRDATPILRDLVARYRLLSHADRTTARGLLARPTDSSDSSEHHYRSGAILGKLCDSTRPLCVHWDEKTNHRDAPPGADNNAATIPADVQATLDTFAGVYDLEVDTYGYLAPLPDGTSTPDDGGDDRTDIYLADLGGDLNPFFGYCTTDDPNAFDFDYPYYDVSAYCVVDEDFAEFGPPGTEQGFRDVTSAHEFFHAIQFHYDWLEDLWLMEGTAMVMEDQYADDVNDNVNYLGNSVLTSPSVPVDRGSGGFEYGAWIWWRFVIEDLGQLVNPLVIREEWERVAAASTDTDGPGPDNTTNDLYSLQGLRKVATRERAPVCRSLREVRVGEPAAVHVLRRGRHVPEGKGEEDVHARAAGHGQRLAIAQIAPSRFNLRSVCPRQRDARQRRAPRRRPPSRSRGFPEGLRAREGRRPAVERARDRAERLRERGAPRRIRPRRDQGSGSRSDECEHAHALRSQHVVFVHRRRRGRPPRLCLPRHRALTERGDVDKVGSGLAQRVDQLR